MARPERLKQVEQEWREPLDTLLPRLIEEAGSIEQAACKLGVSGRTIFRWLQRNGYERELKVVWVKRQGTNHHPRKRLSL